MTCIGFVGKSGSGKDTSAEYLVKHYGFERIAFADALKTLCASLFDVDVSLFHDVDKKDSVRIRLVNRHVDSVNHKIYEFLRRYSLRYADASINNASHLFVSIFCRENYLNDGATPREIAQLVGTEVMRNVIDDDIWIEIVRSTVQGSDTNYVLTDIRFPNELSVVDYAIGINRETEASFNHSSETHVAKIIDSLPFVIANNGTIQSLHQKVEQIKALIDDDLDLPPKLPSLRKHEGIKRQPQRSGKPRR